MRYLDKQSFEEIRNWVYRNARPLDLALWNYHFEGGGKEDVLSALLVYQNADGGFGKVLEPDNWNPESTPYLAQHVIRILRQIDFYEMDHPIYQGLFRFLENTEYQRDFGWFFVVPSNDNYPHAVWWDYKEEDNVFQSIGTTASLSGFILRYGHKQSGLYKRALEYAERLIHNLPSTTNFGDMGVKGYLEFIEDIKKTELGKEWDCQSLRSRINALISDKIKRETGNFMASPLEFIPSPESELYGEYKDEVEAALDRMIEARPALGVWGIPWEWYNGNKYPKEFAISENWWRSFEAIDKLLKLERFGRLERSAGFDNGI